jgi:hypothetical protein
VFANVTSLTVDPMFLRHDLLIELGRLEMAIGDIRSSDSAEPHHLAVLETQHTTVSQTLGRIIV